MAQQHLKFAIFGNEYQAKKSASIEKILLYLEKKEAEVYVENAYYEFLTRDQHLDVKAAGVFEDYNFDVDYVISMGGDGTFLKAASRVGAKGTPIIGVNMGRLGFLADVLPSEIESALDSLYAGECLIEEHAVIQVEDVEKISIAKTGSAFEHLSCFPDRINTEFIQILDQHTIKMRVWERGSGETLSCGTGACAAAVAAMLSGCVSEGETAVELRGGRLFVTWDRTKNKVLLTGPAETVFEGTLAERI